MSNRLFNNDNKDLINTPPSIDNLDIIRHNGKMLLPNNEFDSLAKGIAKLVRDKIKEGVKSIQPRMFFVVDTLFDQPLREEIARVKEQYKDVTGIVPQFLRPMIESAIDNMPIGEDRFKMMFELGKTCPYRIVGLVVVAEMCLSYQQSNDEDFDPSIIGIISQTIDKRSFFFKYKVKRQIDGNLQIVGEDRIKGADIPLTDEFWRGYLSNMKARKEGKEVNYEDFQRGEDLGDVIVKEHM